MAFATHIIKIKGRFNAQKWTKEELRSYVNKKISNEIESFYHTNIELLQNLENNIEVWVYISALPSEAKLIGEWIENHIKEEGIMIKGFEVEKIMNCLDPINKNTSQIIIHLP